MPSAFVGLILSEVMTSCIIDLLYCVSRFALCGVFGVESRSGPKHAIFCFYTRFFNSDTTLVFLSLRICTLGKGHIRCQRRNASSYLIAILLQMLSFPLSSSCTSFFWPNFQSRSSRCGHMEVLHPRSSNIICRS